MARFLVVDDDPVNVTSLSTLLTSDGHEVSPFTRGAEAVQALMSASYDAVVTDLDMPEVDGHAVVRTTRERHPHTCVVVVTGRAEEAREALAQAGACIVLDKPIDYDGVTEAVTSCRSRGGPGASGLCHLRATGEEQLVPLRRR